MGMMWKGTKGNKCCRKSSEGKRDDRTLFSHGTKSSMPSLASIRTMESSHHRSENFTTMGASLSTVNSVDDLLTTDCGTQQNVSDVKDCLSPVFHARESCSSRWDECFDDLEPSPKTREKAAARVSPPTKNQRGILSQSANIDMAPSRPTRRRSGKAIPMNGGDGKAEANHQCSKQVFGAQEAIDYLMNSRAAKNNSEALELLDDLTTELRNNVQVKNRRYHFRQYKNCFIASEAIDYLISSGYALTRKGAVDLGRALQRAFIFEHVCGDHAFKDGHYFFRFINVKPSHEIIEAFKAGVPTNDRKYRRKTYKQCFVGEEAVTWFVDQGYATTREDAVDLGKAVQRSNIFDHVCGDHEFSDGHLLFRFLTATETLDAYARISRGNTKRSRRKLQSVSKELSESLVESHSEEEPEGFHFPFTLEFTSTAESEVEETMMVDDDGHPPPRSSSTTTTTSHRQSIGDNPPTFVRRRSSVEDIVPLDYDYDDETD